MSLNLALKKILEAAEKDSEHFLSAFPTHLLLRLEMVKGTSGGATGQVEYIGYALPDVLKTESKWLIKKNIYDSAGFMTQSLFANGEAKFNKVMNSYAGYTYTET